MKLLVALSSAVFAAGAGIDPAYAVNVTVFHVNEANYTGTANMDTGDASGDTFFSLKSVFVPIECANPDTHYGGDCDNPEVVGLDLTVTKVVIELDSRFGNYSECNVCVNSTVPFTKDDPCVDGDYVCVCGDFHHLTTDCPPTVGREEPAVVFNGFNKPTIGSPNYVWWLHNLVQKVGGYWYSTPSSGECKEDGSVDPCYWRVVKTDRQIKEKCQSDYVFAQVRTQNPTCFEKCDQPSNTTSTCVIECFYRTVLGPFSGHSDSTGQGLTKEEVVGYWTFPIDNDESKGGCPDYKP